MAIDIAAATGINQSRADSETHTISEAEFIKLCEDIYADRQQIYEFNPSAGKREALLWMLLGCLINLLSIPDSEQSRIGSISSRDPYGDAIREILLSRTQPHFQPQAMLADLTRKIENE